MDPSLQPLLRRLDQLSEQFRELRDGVQKAVLVAELDPEMALTRTRKVLEYVVRDVYQHRINEPPGTRPLENLLQRLVKDGFFPDRLDAYANTIRKLGNVGTHTFGEKITVADVYQSLSQLTYVLEWYFEQERPEALTGRPAPEQPPPAAAPVKSPEASATAAPGTRSPGPSGGGSSLPRRARSSSPTSSPRPRNRVPPFPTTSPAPSRSRPGGGPGSTTVSTSPWPSRRAAISSPLIPGSSTTSGRASP